MMRYFFSILAVFIAVSCDYQMPYRYIEGQIYGTFFHISYAKEEDLEQEVREVMEEVNVSLSMFNPQSVIARLNRNESESTDELFRRMFKKAVEINQITAGAFDITVAPLVNAWGFGYAKQEFPDSARIASLREVVGIGRLSLAGERLVKQKEGIEMDASSIAKGLGVDLVAEYLDKRGVRDYMVEIGGEVRVKGKSSKGRPWRIGIDRPEEDDKAQNRELQLVVELTNGALATSGNYRNFYIHEGKKYAHTIHPLTGYPVQTEVLSSSVYAPTCMEADAYATAFMVTGLDQARKIIQDQAGLEGCFIYEEDGMLKTWMSEGFREKVK